MRIKMLLHKYSVVCALFLVLILAVSAIAAEVTPYGYCKGIRLSGRVKVMEHFTDIKVQVVQSFADLKIQSVDALPYVR